MKSDAITCTRCCADLSAICPSADAACVCPCAVCPSRRVRAVVSSGQHWSSVVISGTLSGHQWSSVVISGHQWSSACTHLTIPQLGHQWSSVGQSVVIRMHLPDHPAACERAVEWRPTSRARPGSPNRERVNGVVGSRCPDEGGNREVIRGHQGVEQLTESGGGRPRAVLSTRTRRLGRRERPRRREGEAHLRLIRGGILAEHRYEVLGDRRLVVWVGDDHS